ncbi:DUF3035 domain-containing protein [Candidatus Paracaedibacter symbiosus]|uniref:DUF3035 domain-containing protein n=1 Tax=Candidatus Paracaedibacter symbiosus TaxID=244582 RepID=UPI0018DBC09B|nr:DUF3035 domain-containing protein [Candidatus Paracaedibacter symbiosus]
MTKNKQIILSLTLLVAGTALGGCDRVRNTFGLDHYQADEFRVPTNPPLSMPPNFNLPVPKPGAENPGAVNHREYAQEKVVGQKVTLTKTANDAEKSILEKASKTSKADPNIRSEVNKEAEEEQTLLGKLKNIGNKASSNLSQGTKAEDYREEVAAPKTYEKEQKATESKD